MASQAIAYKIFRNSPGLSDGHAIILRIVTRKNDPGSILRHVGFKNSVLQDLVKISNISASLQEVAWKKPWQRCKN